MDLLAPALIGGVLTGGIYALVALGLTLIYGVLHIVNFAHGSLLMMAMFGAWLLATQFGLDPLAALPLMAAVMFAAGWALYRFVIGRVAGGDDRAMLLATLAVAVILDNLALVLFTGDTRTIETPYSLDMVQAGPYLVPLAKLIAFACALLIAGALWAFMALTDTGRAIRAVAREPEGACLVGIRPQRIFALAYGIGIACLGAAACLLLPSYYVHPGVGESFVLIAFTIVVLGGMGSFAGALLGGFVIGLTESLGGLFLGENLGRIGVFVIFIAILLFRPTGLFGQRA